MILWTKFGFLGKEFFDLFSQSFYVYRKSSSKRKHWNTIACRTPNQAQKQKQCTQFFSRITLSSNGWRLTFVCLRPKQLQNLTKWYERFNEPFVKSRRIHLSSFRVNGTLNSTAIVSTFSRPRSKVSLVHFALEPVFIQEADINMQE